MYTYIYTDKAARWAIGSSGVVFVDFRWFDVSVWSAWFSGEAGVESTDRHKRETHKRDT